MRSEVEYLRPTAELSPEIIKTICDAIAQEFYNWELKEDEMTMGELKSLIGHKHVNYT